MRDVREEKREVRLRKPTFAVASEFLPTLRAQCHRGSTNQPPKCTQQHHYHFIARMFHFRERAPRYYFLFRSSLTESLPFGIASARGNGDVDHIRVSLKSVITSTYVKETLRRIGLCARVNSWISHEGKIHRAVQIYAKLAVGTSCKRASQSCERCRLSIRVRPSSHPSLRKLFFEQTIFFPRLLLTPINSLSLNRRL